VSNNVGKTNVSFPTFEVAPFAIGQTTNATPGQLVPPGARITFDLNLADPFVLAYVQAALNTGRLRLMVASLHTTAGQFGAPSYPDFATHFNEAVIEPSRLELEGVTVSEADLDADGLPDDWELFRLKTLAQDGGADADGDRSTNRAEFRAGTDPLADASVCRILSVTRDADGRSVLRFSHAASRRYSVEFTESFSSWTPVTNSPLFELSTGVAHLMDESSESPKRFYRVSVDAVLP
jgi:hypothetical protein